MSSVTFSTTVGGDGSTVTDDDNATTGLGNGGALIRLVPMMQQVVNVAETTVAAATSSLGGATTNSTSTTSLSIATGSKSLTLVESGKAYTIGQYVIIASTASPTNYMVGQVTSFSGTSLVVNVTVINGSGTIAAWSISVTAVASTTSYLPLAGGTMTGNIVFNAGQTVDGTNGIGYINIPQNSQSAAYTLVAADAGKHIFHPSTDANARTFTIPANGSVAYPIGTAISFVNMTSQVVSIAITTDTMYLAGTGTTGTRSLAQYGTATALKMTSTTWIISGAGLT
jgi:hypothetical protein